MVSLYGEFHRRGRLVGWCCGWVKSVGRSVGRSQDGLGEELFNYNYLKDGTFAKVSLAEGGEGGGSLVFLGGRVGK